MAEQRSYNFFIHVHVRSCLRNRPTCRPSCQFGWTFVIFLGVICGRIVENSRPPVTLKSPTTCESRPEHCLNKANEFHVMPWSCPQSSCSANYSYRFDNTSGEKSRTLSADLFATIYYRHGVTSKNSCLHVLNLTWTVKLYDSDLPVVGFRLQNNRFMPSKNVNQTRDVLFFLQQRQKLPVDKNGNSMLYYDCLILSEASKYRFHLFSRHQSPDHNSEGLERLIGTTNLSTNCDMYPDGHFIPDHSVHTGYINVSRSDRDCSVTAYFSPASEAFGFSGYNVQLISNNDVITEKKNLPFTCENFEPVSFKNVGPGSYRLKVIPVGGRCPCTLCKECKGFHRDFDISNSTCTYPMLEPTPAQVSEGVSRSTESAVSIKNQNIVITVSAVIVASVIVLAVVLGCKSRKHCRDTSGGHLTRQPVLLIYASDNCFHSEVVHCLAVYLQAHCHCDVRFDQWFQTKISEVSALDWILHQLRSVKNVVIVNSEAGFRQYKASMSEIVYEKILHETPLEDMFLPAMQNLHTDYYLKPKSRKLFKVAFPYTASEFVISDFNSGITYQLMTHIEDLFLNIHGLSKHSWRGKTTVEGINHEDYTQSPEGFALEKAIREATKYFKQNPNWFSDVYQVKPKNYQVNVSSSVDKELMKEHHLALRNGSFDKSDPLSLCDSGIGTSLENQNFLDNFKRNVPGDEQTETFKAPDFDDVSSVSSASIELQAVIYNKEYDSLYDNLYNRLLV